jgi:photosystem II stability/assembly factor-like uncharacterized protein
MTIYVGLAGRGVFKSWDGGANWREVNDGLTDLRGRAVLAVAPNGSGTIYFGTSGSGVFKSIDRGEHWLPTALADQIIYGLTIHPNDPNTIYAATQDNSIFASHDGGTPWK